MKKGVIGSILKSLAGGTVAPVTAIIKGTATAIKENKEKELAHSPKGKVDWPKIIGLLITLFVIVAYVFDWINEEQFRLISNKLNINKLLELF